ncbi:MAG: hypothetical protein KGI27_14105 [Thaumarchaeota archaeon]|nr:hypothetical protein [Nitrososphaerota archaeon]
MDHFSSYAAAGNACLAEQERMDAQAERIEARAKEIANRMSDNPELWADALADFAYWPAESAVYRKEPQPELVQAIRSLMAGDHAEFGRVCREQIASRIKDAATDRAQQEIAP